jgi:hypothetical protein
MYVLLAVGLFLGRRTQNQLNKNPSGLGNLQPRNWPSYTNVCEMQNHTIVNEDVCGQIISSAT